MKLSRTECLLVIARILVGVIFAYAGFFKLIEPPANFEASLIKYAVFPLSWIPLIARIVPWLEWIFGSLLIVGYATRFTAVAICLMSAAFLVTLGSSQLFLDSGGSDCGCFGGGWLHLSVRQVFFVDLGCLAASLKLASFKSHRWSLDTFLLKEVQKT